MRTQCFLGAKHSTKDFSQKTRQMLPFSTLCRGGNSSLESSLDVAKVTLPVKPGGQDLSLSTLVQRRSSSPIPGYGSGNLYLIQFGQPLNHMLKNRRQGLGSRTEESSMGPGAVPSAAFQTLPTEGSERNSVTGVSQPLACHIRSAMTATQPLSFFIGQSGNACMSGKVILSILSRKLLQLLADQGSISLP